MKYKNYDIPDTVEGVERKTKELVHAHIAPKVQKIAPVLAKVFNLNSSYTYDQAKHALTDLPVQGITPDGDKLTLSTRTSSNNDMAYTADSTKIQLKSNHTGPQYAHHLTFIYWNDNPRLPPFHFRTGNDDVDANLRYSIPSRFTYKLATEDNGYIVDGLLLSEHMSMRLNDEQQLRVVQGIFKQLIDLNENFDNIYTSAINHLVVLSGMNMQPPETATFEQFCALPMLASNFQAISSRIDSMQLLTYKSMHAINLLIYNHLLEEWYWEHQLDEICIYLDDDIKVELYSDFNGTDGDEEDGFDKDTASFDIVFRMTSLPDETLLYLFTYDSCDMPTYKPDDDYDLSEWPDNVYSRIRLDTYVNYLTTRYNYDEYPKVTPVVERLERTQRFFDLIPAMTTGLEQHLRNAGLIS